MSINGPDVYKDSNYRQAMRDEIDRGMDPEELAEIGHSIYGETSIPVEDIPVEIETSPEPFLQPAQPVRQMAQPTRRLFELPGVSKGRVNSDQPFKPGHAQRGLSNGTIDRLDDINHSGAETGLEILRNTKPPRSKNDLS